MRKTKLPLFFKPILWSYKFSDLSSDKDKETIIINAINYGSWKHWQWIINYYGKNKVKKIIENLPKSEFRERSFRLVSLLLGIKRMKYASRSAKIKAERNI